MNYRVFRLLDHEQAERVLKVIANATFVDGRATAQGNAANVKQNLQTRGDDASVSEADGILQKAIAANAEFQVWTQPKAVMVPMYSRYEPGMQYGPHIDGALNGTDVRIRTDLSMTLFLSPPDTYDGGELVIRHGNGEEAVKLDAGEAVVYPSTTIHYVAPVTRGARVAAVTWIQSLVRDAGMREIFWDLSCCLRLAGKHGDAELSLLLGKSYQNLIRHVAEI